MMMTREWDGESYDRISWPMELLGREVVARMPLRGDETVLDAGCGTGRVTEALLDRLPRGRVIGVDASTKMITEARARLGDRADLRVADLTTLDLGGERVDAVLSTATFHWIADHAELFSRLRAVLRDGGRLVAQCGGAGNAERVNGAAETAGAEEPFAEHFVGWQGPWNFARPDETAERLRAAGFAEIRTGLEERPVTPDGGPEWLRTIMLGSHLERLPEVLREPFVSAVAHRLGEPLTIDYVRLNIEATAARGPHPGAS